MMSQRAQLAAAMSQKLQSNLQRFRSLATNSAAMAMAPASRGFSAGDAPQPKVIFDKHTDNVMEFKLNAPKVLNSLDAEMSNLMIEKIKTWRADESL